jgi:hypothetical protein
LLESGLFLEIAYILFSFAMFITIFLCPIFFTILKIFDYNLNFDYIKLNYSVFFYYLPLGLGFYFFPNIISLSSGYYVAFFTIALLCLYNLPLTYLLNRYVFHESGLKKFLMIFMIFTSTELSLIYILYQFLN